MRESNQLHAACLDAYPPAVYMNNTSHAISSFVHQYNSAANGYKVWALNYIFQHYEKYRVLYLAIMRYSNPYYRKFNFLIQKTVTIAFYSKWEKPKQLKFFFQLNFNDIFLHLKILRFHSELSVVNEYYYKVHLKINALTIAGLNMYIFFSPLKDCLFIENLWKEPYVIGRLTQAGTNIMFH